MSQGRESRGELEPLIADDDNFPMDDYRISLPLSDLVHAIGHEMGNPLTSIISLGSIILSLASDSMGTTSVPEEVSKNLQKISDYSEAILREAWRVTALSQDLVCFLSCRPEKSEVVSVEPVLHQAVQRVRKVLPENELIISLEIDDKISKVEMEADHLKILLSELVKKAYLLVRGNYPSGFGQKRCAQDSQIQIFVKASGLGDCVSFEIAAVLDADFLEVQSRPISFHPLIDSARNGKKHLNMELATCWVIVGRYGGDLEFDAEKVENERVRMVFRAKIPFHP